ncbi:hypothetical protein RQCS_18740 [Rhodococcus qingshengii]|jgi:hypothetical protein|nr:hypothetical protein RQCS_18740 [Rhodococcus qingshengii]GCB55504.1 hypothetical protein rerp_19120 [Rhodococcus erythropolis]
MLDPMAEDVMAALDVSVDESLSSEEQPTTPKTAKEAAAVTARTRVEVFMGLPS